MDNDRQIAQRLRDAREDSDVSQEEVAKHLHLSQSAYSRRETGVQYFSVGQAVAAATYLNADIKQIFF